MTAIDATTEHDDHAHDHPTDRKYVNIALILGFLTAVEILMFVFEDTFSDVFGDDAGRALVKIGLIVLMVIKFWIVASYFMHLKFDTRVLAGLFVFGLALAVLVYFIMLSAFEFSFWNDGYDDPGLPDL